MASAPQAAKDALDAAVESAQKRVEQNPLFGFSPLSAGLGMTGQEAFGSPHPPAAGAEAATPAPNKQLDFGVGGNGVDTPATPILPASADDDVDYVLFIKETLLWSNKIRSTFYFVTGLVLWSFVRAVFRSSITLPTGVCYVLLASLFFNFLRAVIAPKLAERCTWSGSSWTRFAASTATATINAAAAVYDRNLNGLDPLRTLEVGLGLWALSLLGRAIDAVTLLLLLHLAAFSLPATYSRFKPKVDAAVADVYGKAKTQYDALPRKIKAPAVAAVLVVLAVLLPTFDRAVAIFTALVYGRTILKPSEYASFAKRVEPVAAGFKAMGDKATHLAVGVANKYELTPTPLKKRK